MSDQTDNRFYREPPALGEIEYRALWEERMAWRDDPTGYKWIPFSGRVFPDIWSAIQHCENLKRDQKMRGAHVEARLKPEGDQTWTPPYDYRDGIWIIYREAL